MTNKATYCDYFGFTRDPFSIAPDPALLYPSEQHKQALAHLKYGLDREGGFILLTGEVGTGKTTLTRLLLQQVPGNLRVAYILNTKLDSAGVLASICKELGVQLSSDAQSDLRLSVEALNDDLLEAHSQRKKTLVVIEEAQNLDSQVLETLRLLTNLETNTSKLLHILLVGQPELLDTLALKNLRQLNQRVISRHHLRPLQQDDIANYLAYRLQKVGSSQQLFTDKTIRLLFKYTGGIPRKLNLLSERCLLGVYASGGKQVTPSIVDQANREVFASPKQSNLIENGEFKKTGLVAFLLLLLILGAVVYHQFFQPTERLLTVPVTVEQSADLGSVKALETIQPVGQLAAQQLFDLWQIETTKPTSLATLCADAVEQGLACESLTNTSFETIVDLARVGLVSLLSRNDETQHYAILAIESDQITLSNAEGLKLLTTSEFINKWLKDYMFLWQPPRGYNKKLYQGDSNRAVLNWLLTSLKEVNPKNEELITGGVYSAAVAQQVKVFQQSHGLSADGIVGVQTIIKLQNTTQSEPSSLMIAPGQN